MKKTVIFSLLTAIAGLSVGNALPRGIVSDPISITTFEINVPFEKWAESFDSEGTARLHNSNKITPLFRGVSIDNPKQVIVIHQSEPGIVERLLLDNKDIIKETGHIMRTTKTSNWKFK